MTTNHRRNIVIDNLLESGVSSPFKLEGNTRQIDFDELIETLDLLVDIERFEGWVERLPKSKRKQIRNHPVFKRFYK